MSVAYTILHQLGGQRFAAMTGAKNMVAHPDALQLDLPARFAKNGINRVIVRLNSLDLYDLTFYRKKGLDLVEIASTSMIYADGLRRAFTAYTGLDCTL